MPALFRCFQPTRQPALRQIVRTLACGATLALGASQAQAWNLDDVAALARQRSQAPYQPAAQAMPPELAQLGYDGHRDIRYKPALNLWRAEQSPYEVNFLHAGAQGEPVRIHEITPQGVKPLAYDPTRFDFGKNPLDPRDWGDLGHGGLRAFSHLNSSAHKDELIAFSGASYFRALGTGQRYGLSARGLALDTAGAAKEEFPRFTDFWLEKPTATDAGTGATADGPLTIYALMDSERMSGGYRFDIQPGEQTVTEVHARIFMRATEKPVTTLGLAPLTSMFLSGENQPQPGDFRPEVHDSDGLMIATGEGEWLWRPLQNPAAPLVTSFAMQSLKGFGLMQRDRAFTSYEDTEARYELRPSAWVTPLAGFGAGRVELLQFSTPDETHDNVAAYWVPERLPAPGEALDIAYQIAWQGKNQQRPPNGWVTQSRKGVGYSRLSAEALARQTQFVIDFAGPALDALPEDAPVQAIATASANARIVESLTYRNPANGSWRMTLRVERLPAAAQPDPAASQPDPARQPAQPGQAPQSALPDQPIELRAFLQHQQHTLSETWTNLITP